MAEPEGRQADALRTPEEHATRIRLAAEALNAAIREAAHGAAVGVEVDVRIFECVSGVAVKEVRVLPFKVL